MSHEILYTSAKSGLRSGSTGFCTVRSTAGLPRNLATALEQLTSYSHAVDPYNADCNDQHPVNFAHYILRLGSQRFHVLGRIANAPLDHTNRSNKLAQLIAFDSSELNASSGEGPAAELQQFARQQRWVTTWNPETPPQLLPDSARMVLPGTAVQPPSACETWKRTVGHAGWAGVLAETARGRGSYVPVIFSADQATLCLPLVREALSLLAPADRWETTFSTYFSANLPTRVECRWRFLLDTSDLARKARRDPRVNAIDLPAIRSAGQAPPASDFTRAACGSTRPWLDGVEVMPAADHKAPLASIAAPDQVPRDGMSAGVNARHADPSFAPSILDDAIAIQPVSSRSPMLATPLALILVLLLGVGALIAFWFLSGPGDDAFDEIVQQSDERLGQTESDLAANTTLGEFNTTEPQNNADANTEVQVAANESPDPIATPDLSDLAPAAAVPQPAEPIVSPLEGIREAHNVLPLPGLDKHGWFPLAGMQCDDPKQLTLEITGDQAVMKTTTLETEFGPLIDGAELPGDDSEESGWKVIRRNTSSTRRTETVGYFRLHNHLLEFRWDYSNKTTELRNCALALSTNDGESETCMLREVESGRPARLDFKLGRSSADPPVLLADNELLHTDSVRVELTFANLPQRSEPNATRSLGVGDTLRIPIYEEDAAADAPPVVEIQLTLQATPRHGVRLMQTTFLKWTDLTVYPDPGSSNAPSRGTQQREILSDGRLRQIQDRYGDALTNAEKALDTLRSQIKELETQKERIDPENKQARASLQVIIEGRLRLEKEYQSLRDLCKDFPGRVRRLETLLAGLEKSVEIHFDVSLDSPGVLKPVPLVSSR